MTNQLIKKNHFHLLIIFIVASIITLLNYNKYTRFGFELDEIFLINESQEINPLKYFDLLNRDLGNPILFFVLLKPFLMISTNEIWLRTLPLIFYFLSIWIFYELLGELKISSRLKLLTSIIFLGLAPYYSLRFYVRPYSLLLFLILLTIYQTFKVKRKQDLKELIKLAIIIFLGFHTHYIYWLFSVVWFLSSLITNKNFNFHKYIKQKEFILINLCLLISLSPIVLNLINRELLTTSLNYWWWQLARHPISFPEILELILKIEFKQNFNPAIYNLSFLCFLAISILALKKKLSKNQQVLLVFSNFFWLIYLFTPLKNYLVEIKYIAIFISFIPVCIVIIINKLFNVDHYLKSKKIMFCLTSLVIIWSLLPALEKYKIEPRTDWKSVVQVIDDYRTDYAITTDCYDAMGLRFYAKNDLQFYGYSGFLGKNSCEFPSITEHAINLDKILLVGERVVPLPIEDTHSLVLFSGKYSPINLYFYHKK